MLYYESFPVITSDFCPKPLGQFLVYLLINQGYYNTMINHLLTRISKEFLFEKKYLVNHLQSTTYLPSIDL